MDRLRTGQLVVTGLLLAFAGTALSQDPAAERAPRCVKAIAGRCTDWVTPPPGYAWDDGNRPTPVTPAAASQPRQQAAPVDAESQYYSDTLAAESDCERDGGDRMNCYVTASPHRCKQTAVSMVGDPSGFQRTWTMCVRSCGTATAWSRTFGDCRR